jgi:hypothetical protein
VDSYKCLVVASESFQPFTSFRSRKFSFLPSSFGDLIYTKSAVLWEVLRFLKHLPSTWAKLNLINCSDCSFLLKFLRKIANVLL